MLNRCHNKKYEKYSQWGGRGIRVHKKWHKFENFLSDMGHPPTKHHSLDRKNNNKGYNKTNCRWATHKEQARNKRNNRLITFNSETKCLSAWGEHYQIKPGIISDRLNRGWSTKKALTTKPKSWKNKHRPRE